MGNTEFSYADPNGFITSLSFSPDGNQLVSGDDAGTFIQWDTEGGHCLRVYPGNGEAVRSAVYLPDSDLLLAATTGSLTAWDSRSGNEQPLLDLPFYDWQDVRFIPETPAWAVRSTGRLQYWTPDGQSVVGDAEIPTDAVFSPNADRFAEIADDSTFRIFSTATRNLLYSLKPPTRPSANGIPPALTTRNFVFSPDGKTAAIIPPNNSGDGRETAEIWDYTRGILISSITKGSWGGSSPTRLVFSPDGELAAFAVYDHSGEFGQNIYIFEVASGGEISTIWNKDKLIFDFSADSLFLATGCDPFEQKY
jgi:WD40 repeat protein